MAQTVIGVFDYDVEGQNAYQELLSSGFTHANVDFAPQEARKAANNSSNYRDKDKDNDSIGSFFSNLFGSDDDTRSNYTEVGQRGAIVTVHAQSKEEAERAADILDRNGAVDVDERASQYRSGADLDTIRSSNSSYADTAYTDRGVTDNDSVKIVEENLNVGKRVVNTGGVRLRSRIIERPVEETLRLRVEHVNVERIPVNRAATDADLNNFREGTIEVTEQREVPIVSKEARVVEEVRLSKEVEEVDETIRDTVRSTDVDVENINSDEDVRYGTDRTYGTDNLDRGLDDDERSRPGSL